jgi:predicted molibdopterin-dependent oxidoreductase YjgC
MCDPGRALYKEIGVTGRVSGARVRGAATWDGVPVSDALDLVAGKLKEAGEASAFLATPQGTNEDLFAFKTLADAVKGQLDFRVGDPQLKVRERIDEVLQRADRNLQGPELLRVAEVVDAVTNVPLVVVMATHEGPELDRAHVVLPAAVWAETDGTFTNYQRRVQRLRAAATAPGDAAPRWELAAGVLERLGEPLGATSAREVFGHLARSLPDYAGLDYRAIGARGRALDGAGETTSTAQEARA